MNHTFNFDGDYGSSYDQLAHQIAPAREIPYQLGSLLLGNVLPEQAHLLIVGTGTGLELITFGQQHPGWTFTGIEPAEQMAALTQQKLHQFDLQARVKLHRSYINDLDSTPEFDAASMMYVLHFISSDALKVALLREVALRIKPGGYLILGLHQEIPPDYHDLFISGWKGYMAQQGMPATEIARFLQRCQEGLYPTTEEQTIALVEQAGFERPIEYFQAYFQSVWISRKSSGAIP